MSDTLPPPDPTTIARSGPARRERGEVESIVIAAGVATAAGAVSGFVWGGVGGRIAMRIVFLTSSESLAGLTSDDGFEIGTFSGATVFLLIFATILGAVAGLVVGLVRAVTLGPTWLIAPGFALATAAAGGATIVHTDGVDFRFLEPLWLTVGLFVLIPGLWAASVVVLTDRLLRSPTVVGAPVAFDHGRWRLVGWVLLLVVAVLGARDLAADIASLR